MDQILELLDDGHWVTQAIFIVSTLIIAAILTWLLRFSLRVYVDKSSKYLQVEPTNYRFLKHAISLVIYGVAMIIIFYQIPPLRSLATGLFAISGVVAAVIAFASQAAFSNIISGIFIVIFKPFRVHDVITVGDDDLTGDVIDITLRHTVIKDYENKRIIIPNSQISKDTIINFSIDDPFVCQHVYFHIALDSDINKAFTILREEIFKHELSFKSDRIKQIQGGEDLRIKITDVGEYYLKIRCWVWTASPQNAWMINWELNKIIIEKFRENGIETPVPHRKIIE